MRQNDHYEICVEGCLGASWEAWFEGVQLRAVRPTGAAPERTILVVPGADQATLFGVLAQIGALNLRLLSVELRPDQPT